MKENQTPNNLASLNHKSDRQHLHHQHTHHSHPNQQQQPVTVFWDIENCSVPNGRTGYQVVKALRQYAFGLGDLKNISVIGNVSALREDLRSSFADSGVLLHDVPSKKPGSSDIAILVELLKLTTDFRPPHSVVLITGDRDFSKVVTTLVNRRYTVVLITNNQASEVLKAAANEALDWSTFLEQYSTVGSPSVAAVSAHTQQSSVQPVQTQPQIIPTSVYPRTTNNVVVLDPPYTLPVASERGGSPARSYNNATKQIAAPYKGLLEVLSKLPDRRADIGHLGSLIPPDLWRRQGFQRFRDFCDAAKDAGLISMRPNPYGTIIVQPFDRDEDKKDEDARIAFSLLPTSNKTLRKDGFFPVENVLKARLKIELFNRGFHKIANKITKSTCGDLWDRVVKRAEEIGWQFVNGAPGYREVYLPEDAGNEAVLAATLANINKPKRGDFSNEQWNTFLRFVSSPAQHRFLAEKGRYRFAEALHDCHVPGLEGLSLGLLTELVQLGINEKLLGVHGDRVVCLGGSRTSPTRSPSPPTSSPSSSSDAIGFEAAGSSNVTPSTTPPASNTPLNHNSPSTSKYQPRMEDGGIVFFSGHGHTTNFQGSPTAGRANSLFNSFQSSFVISPTPNNPQVGSSTSPGVGLLPDDAGLYNLIGNLGPEF